MYKFITENYKNKTAGMKDDVRYNLWRQILEDYNEQEYILYNV